MGIPQVGKNREKHKGELTSEENQWISQGEPTGEESGGKFKENHGNKSPMGPHSEEEDRS